MAMPLTERRQIHLGARFEVYRAKRDGRSVVVKRARSDRTDPLSDTRLRHEYALLANLRVPGVVTPLALEETDGKLTLLLPDVGPINLEEWLQPLRLEVGTFLDLAASMANTLAQVHAHHIVHRDLSLANFVFDTKGGLTLVDFDLATMMAAVRRSPRRGDVIEATLPYLAPEQTGRVRRPTDQRADLYALGALFYQMLVGQPPFPSEDPLEIIHGHLAQTPALPETLRPELPVQLSAIVMKLLAKMPEWRYQTAESLGADLEEASRRWSATGRIEGFELALLDRRELNLPSQVFGRDHECAELEQTFSNAVAGSNELVVIQGPAGCGKTALVNVMRPEFERQAWFGAGKCDQLAGNVPFAPFAQAIDGLTKVLMALPPQEADEQRTRILSAVSPNGRVLTEIIPELAHFLGEQPALASAGPMEAANRAELTLLSFVRSLARADRPLVLFLDDLQWSDPASLKLISRVASDPDLRHLLVLLAWRSAEVRADDPAAQAVERARASGAHVVDVEIGPLDANALSVLLSDVLATTPERCRQLGAILVGKTGGNPLFVQRLLPLLRASDCLTFDPTGGSWTWDLTRIAQLAAPQDVVDLLAGSIRRLPSLVQESLAVAACIGNRFDVGLLGSVLSQTPTAVAHALAIAVREVLIVPSGDAAPDGSATYRFVHDRVQQAAYALADEGHRKSVHLAIGRRLLALTPQRELSEHIFEMVDQLNRGASCIAHEAERSRLLELNERAASKARTTSAYGAALAYLRQAISLLPADAWETRYAQTFELFREASELAFVVADRESAEAHSEAALSHARSRLERVTIHTLRTSGYTLMREFTLAVAAGQECLQQFGLDLLDPDPEATVRRSFSEVEQRLSGRTIAGLLDAPMASQPEQIALQRIMSELLALTYQWDPRRYPMIVMWGVLACLEHGHTQVSSHIYVSFALDLVGRGQVARGHAFGRLAIDLARKLGSMEARALFVFSLFVHHWREPFRGALPLARAGANKAIERGDFLFAAFSQYAVVASLWATGENLDSILTLLDEYIAFGNKISNRATFDLLTGQRRAVMHLKVSSGRARRTDGGPDDDAFLEGMKAHPMNIGMYASLRASTSYMLGELDVARRMFGLAKAHIPSFFGSIEYAQCVFHGALTLAACAALASGPARAVLLAEITPLEATLDTWAQNCPENFRHRLMLVRAELARLAGTSAGPLYDQAIDGAARAGFIQDEALAHELSARHALAQDQRHLAAQKFVLALDAYGRWGASAKVELLHSELSMLELRMGECWKPNVSPSEQANLDLLAVFRAAESLASEVTLDGLLEKMMRICAETSGAQRATLLVDGEGQLRVESRFDAEADLFDRPHAGNYAREFTPDAIVRHTLRTGQEVVLGNAAETGAFTRDPYVLAHTCKSILSMAVRHRDRVTAVLLLENELSTDAFTRERIEMLRLLLAQAAISLENARLYDSLRASEALLREFFEGMPVGVYVLDHLGRPVFANRRAEELVGKSFEPTTGAEGLASAYPIYLTGSNELYPSNRLPLVRALQGDTTMADDLEVRRPDRVVPLAAWGTPIRDERGSVRYALVAFQDVSAQHAMEVNRAQLEAQLHQAQRLEAIGRLAGGVAHDFNNLLTPILAYSELAANAVAADSPVRATLRAVVEAAEQAACLTRQLLAFGRQQVIEPRVLDLNDMLRTFEPMFRRLARDNIELELCLEPSLGKVRADPSQLQRVFMNLGLNASDAMPQGGRIVFETCNAGEFVALRVCDTGPGMSKETVAKIFDPFFTTKEHGKGTGLGLPTVYGIVTQHGGRVDVKSEIGKGSIFEVLLPRFDEREDSRRSEPPEARLGADAAGHGERILVVDDNDAVRGVVEDALARDGYRVIATASPAEALRLARELGDDLQLLITDVVMPGMSGNDLAKQLKRERPKLSILLISGYSDEVLAESIGDAVQVLRKPLRTDPLRAKVRALLQRR